MVTTFGDLRGAAEQRSAYHRRARHAEGAGALTAARAWLAQSRSISMQLHSTDGLLTTPRETLRSHRLDARQFCHRHFRAGAGGDVERARVRARRRHSRGRAIDYFWRGHALHRLAADRVADQPGRSP